MKGPIGPCWVTITGAIVKVTNPLKISGVGNSLQLKASSIVPTKMQGLMSINIPTGAVKMFRKCTSGLAWSDHVWWGYKTGIRSPGLHGKLGSPPAVEASKMS